MNPRDNCGPERSPTPSLRERITIAMDTVKSIQQRADDEVVMSFADMLVGQLEEMIKDLDQPANSSVRGSRRAHDASCAPVENKMSTESST